MVSSYKDGRTSKQADAGMVPADKLAPHAPLSRYYGEQDRRSAFVRSLFNDTAADYERLNRILTFGAGAAYRRRVLAAAGLAPGMQVLDVAVGTGLVAREAVALAGGADAIIGLDLSEGMLREAGRLGIPLIQGRMEALPVADGRIDLVSLGYALRHVDDLGATFAEFYRVLKPGGRLVILEFGRPVSWFGRLLIAPLMGGAVPWLSQWLTGRSDNRLLMRYCWDTVREVVPEQRIIAAMKGAGFGATRWEVNHEVLRCYYGRKPG
jgi:demethylmenaquinone methyltransferase/2-methoxy-6-polyprenyl-1,4-benzoquinol methylase